MDIKKIKTNLNENMFLDHYEASERTETFLNDLGDRISIMEFSIAPKLKSIADTKSISFLEPTGSISNDPYFNQYLKETSQWRNLRKRINLPELTHQKISKNRKNIWDLKKLKDIEIQLNSVRYEPTYQLEPYVKFDSCKAEQIMQDVLQNFIENILEPETMNSKSSVKSSIEHLTTSVKSRVKLIADKRYKLVVNTCVFEKCHQGVLVGSKCLWDAQNDVCVSVNQTYRNYVFVINLYAVYHE